MSVFIPTTDEEFLRRVVEQLPKARARFPRPNPTVAALVEEVGEAAQALLHIRENKPNHSSEAVVAEAVQVALMAMRLATEGDETITPTLRAVAFPKKPASEDIERFHRLGTDGGMA